jgi:G3E family GTPase
VTGVPREQLRPDLYRPQRGQDFLRQRDGHIASMTPPKRDRQAVEQHRDIVSVSLRFDEALHQQLVAEARRAVRSLNGEIIYRLRKSIEAHEPAA